MFCYVDRYFVILFRLLHFLFQRDLVSFHWFLNMTSFHRNRYTQIIYIYIYIYIITDYIICVYAVYMLMYTYTYMYVYMCVCVYIYICAVIPHTALLSHSELPQGKFLHRDSPICSKHYCVLHLIFTFLHLNTTVTVFIYNFML